jgi:hypothetical protein
MEHHAVKAHEGFRALFHLQYCSSRRKITVRSQQVHLPGTLLSKKDLDVLVSTRLCGLRSEACATKRKIIMPVGYRTAIRHLCIDFLYKPLILSVGNVLRFVKMLTPVT